VELLQGTFIKHSISQNTNDQSINHRVPVRKAAYLTVGLAKRGESSKLLADPHSM
jgi:hypothetical protein